MRTTDNNCGKPLNELGECNNIDDLYFISNKSLHELQENNPNLLIFPKTFGKYHDDVEKSIIFSLSDHGKADKNNIKLITYNLMGFIGRNDTQLTISSRFATNDEHDYFLHYMLQKVFSINILNFDQTKNKDSIWDFLLYLFPYYLNNAYSKGLYKEYKREEYNDVNIKGTIDVKRHIKMNIPFNGEIAYTTRQYSYDNAVTQLIRHTIEHIKTHPWGNKILSNNDKIREAVNEFTYATQNSYNKNARQKIINANLKPVTHPYFTEYKILQKICKLILQRGKISFGQEKDKIYGLLFDGAWLWEEYLNTILKDIFMHPENKTGENGFYLFNKDNKNFQSIYPDFISQKEPQKGDDEKPKKVADAKYMPLDKQKESEENSEKAISIYYKTITYMYRFSSNEGYLFFPYSGADTYCETYKIIDTDGTLKKIGLKIPQSAENFNKFIEVMQKNEQEFIDLII